MEIEKIKLTLAGQEVELTMEHAKELKSVLENLFPSQKVETIPFPVPQPYPVPAAPPIIIERWPETPWWQQPTITCDGESNILCMTAK
ncbi:MAG: hypothetical protein AAGJ81_10605 [Verrucomicrobiota bacterium]